MTKPSAKPSGGSDHRAALAAMPFRERRRILRTVNRGRVVEDPSEATIAVGVARSQQRFWRLAWLLGPVASLLALREGLAPFLFNLVVATTVLGGMSLFFYLRVRRAERLNRDLLERPKGKPKKAARGHLPRSNVPHGGADGEEFRPDPATSKKKLERRKKRRRR